MSGVFQNIDPSPPGECVPPPPGGAVGRTHSLGGEGVGGQFFGRHSSVLYICKYFVGKTIEQKRDQCDGQSSLKFAKIIRKIPCVRVQKLTYLGKGKGGSGIGGKGGGC
jgi:hypothetical protein